MVIKIPEPVAGMELLCAKEDEESEEELQSLAKCVLGWVRESYFEQEPQSNEHHQPSNLISSFNPADDSPPSAVGEEFRLLLLKGLMVTQGSSVCKLLLTAGYMQELAVGGMKHSDAEWEVYTLHS